MSNVAAGTRGERAAGSARKMKSQQKVTFVT
jgi:hypothetical protein